jgi:dephospho-CoA kinase
MRRIGLTGNIGTGKSTVARIFEILGVPVYHADKQAKELMEQDKVKEQISLLFGKHLVNSSKQIDRKALAAIVFTDKDKLALLNNLIHPLVEEDFEKWSQHYVEKPYILHEAAILFESGFNRLFEANILVTAPEALCISRVMVRDGVSNEMVVNRMSNQWSQEQKQKIADYLVVNDEKSMVIPQVLANHKTILEK